METGPGTSGSEAAGGDHVPQVSIVLPVHNGARYLAEALDSILAQTFTHFELIAVDDCSSDETPEILAHYAARDPRMRVITNPRNLKLPGSLNAGFAQARGAWFTWTSDDNILRPQMLERLLSAAADHPDRDVIHADYTLIDDRGIATGKVRVREADQLVMGNCIGCSFLYRAEVDRALGGYDEALFGLEDYDFWLRAAVRFRFLSLHEDLYLYRRHEGSLTNSRAREIHGMATRVMQREIAALPPGQRRALAYVNLCCRDHHTMRPGLLRLAWHDSPRVVLQESGRIWRWLRHCIRRRLLWLCGVSAVPPSCVALTLD